MAQWLSEKIWGPDPQRVITQNEAKIAELEVSEADQTSLVEQLKSEAARLAKAGLRDNALKTLQNAKAAEKQLAIISGQLTTVRTQTNHLKGMDTNKALFDSVKDVNAISTQMGKQLDTKEVRREMHRAKKHTKDHEKISELLSGQGYLEETDMSELDAELEQLAGLSVGEPKQSDISRAEEKERLLRELDALTPPKYGKPIPASEARKKETYSNNNSNND